MFGSRTIALLIILLPALAALGVCVAWGQVPGRKGAALPGVPARPPATQPALPPPVMAPILEGQAAPPARLPETKVDPTIPSQEIREMLEAGGAARTPNAPAATPGLPEIKLKARILARDRQPMAMIESGGRLYSVRAGSEFAVPSPGSGDGLLQLKVVELNASEIRIEIANRRQVLLLN